MVQAKTAGRPVVLFAMLSLVILLLSMGWIATIIHYDNIITSLTQADSIVQNQDTELDDQGTNLSTFSTSPKENVGLYKANVNFCVLNGIRKIDIYIGNAGATDTRLLSLAIGTIDQTRTAITGLQDQPISQTIFSPHEKQRVTIDYEWVSLETYYFSVTFSSGYMLEWAEQAPTEPEQLQITETAFDCISNSILVEVKNIGSVGITINEVLVNIVDQRGTTPRLPTEIQPNSELVLKINLGTFTIESGAYQIILVSAKGTQFVCRGTVPSEYQSGVMLYKADTYFYDYCGDLKIYIFVGNHGPSSTQVVQAYIGPTHTAMMNHTVAVVTIGYEQVRKITLDYNWTHGQTYYFKVITSTGHSLEWQEQAPESGTTDHAETQTQLSPIRIVPDTVTVEVGETFSIEVVFKNIPQDPAARGIDVRLTWDPSVLEALSLEDIAFHSAAPENEWDNIWTIRRKIDQGSMWYALTWLDANRAERNGYADIYGNGTLLKLTFKALAVGETDLVFGKVDVVNSDIMPVPIILCDGTVTVT